MHASRSREETRAEERGPSPLAKALVVGAKFAAVLAARVILKKRWAWVRLPFLASLIPGAPLPGIVAPLLHPFARHVAALLLISKAADVALPDQARSVRFWRQMLPIYIAYMVTRRKAARQTPDKAAATWDARHEASSVDVHALILDMSGYYVKSAQILASKSDFMPEAWCRKLSQLFDQIPPRPWSEVRYVLEKELRRCDVHKRGRFHEADVFDDVSTEPIAAASIAQVHTAQLSDRVVQVLRPDSAQWAAARRSVVIKVQHKGMEGLMNADLRNIGRVATFLRGVLPFDVMPIVREIRTAIPKEFDFLRELRMMRTIRGRLLEGGLGERVLVPRCVPELCSPRQIVMERMDGVPFTQVLPLCIQDTAAAAEAAAAAAAMAQGSGCPVHSPPGKPRKGRRGFQASEDGGDGGAASPSPSPGPAAARALASRATMEATATAVRALVDAFGLMMVRDGLFHGDPHPGNMLMLEAGGSASVVLLDFGQCKALTAEMHTRVARLIIALDDGDRPAVAELLWELGLRFGSKDGGGDGRVADPETVFKLALIMFDLRFLPEAQVSPFSPDNPILNGMSISAFPQEIYLILRATMLLRGITFALGVDIHTSRLWRPHAEFVLANPDWVQERAAENLAVDLGLASPLGVPAAVSPPSVSKASWGSPAVKATQNGPHQAPSNGNGHGPERAARGGAANGPRVEVGARASTEVPAASRKGDSAGLEGPGWSGRDAGERALSEGAAGAAAGGSETDSGPTSPGAAGTLQQGEAEATAQGQLAFSASVSPAMGGASRTGSAVAVEVR